MKNFLSKVLPNESVLYAVVDVQTPEATYKAHYKAATIDELVKRIQASTHKSNVFMALASYEPPITKTDAAGEPILNKFGKPATYKRTKRQVKHLKSIWLDIDVGESKDYSTQVEALQALAEFIKHTNMPTPLVTSSGGGIHVYWPLTEMVNAQKWKELAVRLRYATRYYGLHVDPSRTTDEASILRPVGGLNHKYSPPQPVRVLVDAGEYDYGALFQRLNAVDGAENLAVQDAQYTPPSNNPWDVRTLLPSAPIYASVIAEECAVLRKMRDTRGNVPEPVWRGCLGVLKYCTDGEKYIHEWSDGYPGYSREETQEKYDRYQAAPTTCNFFAGYESACNTCPHRGTCTSPIALGHVRDVVVPVENMQPDQPVPTERAEAKVSQVDTSVFEVPVSQVAIGNAVVDDAHKEKFKLPRGYTIEGGKLGRVEITDVGEKFVGIFNFVWYPYARVCNAEKEFSYRCRVIKGTVAEEFELPAKAIASAASIVEMLAKSEIYPVKATSKIRTAMTQYAIDYCTSLVTDTRVTKTFRQFGWNDTKDAVVFGPSIIDKEGVHNAALTGNALSKAAAFAVGNGDTDGWVQAVDYLYNRPNSTCMQYALLSGFGSLLGPFVGGDAYAGIPCAITSQESGIGKTTVAKLALTAFGDWREMFLSSTSGATRLARVSTISAFGNFPVLLDELTDIESADLSELLYNVSNGRDRQRLDSSGNLRPVESWNSSVYITANEHLITKLAAMKVDTEANQVRIFEIDPSKYNVPKLDPIEVDAKLDMAMRSRGAVGYKYIKELVKDTTAVRTLISRVEQSLVAKAPSLQQPKYRFYRYHASCTVAAGHILKALGLISFDVTAVTAWAAQHIETLVNVVRDNSFESRSAHSLLDELVRDLEGGGHLLVTLGYGAGSKSAVPVVKEPRSRLEARLSLIPADGAETPHDGWLYVSSKFVQRWCAERRIGVSDLTEAASEVTEVKPSMQITLSAHTPMQGGRARCLGFDMTVLLEQQAELETVDMPLN